MRRLLIRGGVVAIVAFNVISLHAQIVAPPIVDAPAPSAQPVTTTSPSPQAPPATARPGVTADVEAGSTDELKFITAAQVRIDCLMISGPEEKILPRLARLRDPKQVAAAEQELIEMASRKEAQLEGWPEITTHSGSRAVSESIVEQRYPIDFEFPKNKVADDPKAQNAKGRLVDEAVALAKNTDGFAPTTFETRNVGTTLEAEPVTSPDNTSVTISLSPQIVRFEGYSDFPAGATSTGEKLTIPQPNFTTAKVSTTLTLKSGERRLIHVGKAGSDRSRLEVFVLGATIIPPANGR